VSPSLAIPTIAEVRRVEPQLHAWTEMAARAFGFYSGINEAIKAARDKWPTSAHHASDYRQEMGLMAVIRVFATMDRGSPISFQSVYRYLSTEQACKEVAQVYAEAEPPSPLAAGINSVRESIDRFAAAYGSVDFRMFGRLQSFRNGHVAHISWPEINAAHVTYSDLEKLIRLCCVMAGELRLMLTGCNDWPVDDLDAAHSSAYSFWTRAIEQEAVAHA
jgi:hypothetical protein